jgi:hypothetical protein
MSCGYCSEFSLDEIASILQIEKNTVMDIDEIYRNLPLEEYRTEALESYLKGA